MYCHDTIHTIARYKSDNGKNNKFVDRKHYWSSTNPPQHNTPHTSNKFIRNFISDFSSKRHYLVCCTKTWISWGWSYKLNYLFRKQYKNRKNELHEIKGDSKNESKSRFGKRKKKWTVEENYFMKTMKSRKHRKLLWLFALLVVLFYLLNFSFNISAQCGSACLSFSTYFVLLLIWFLYLLYFFSQKI